MLRNFGDGGRGVDSDGADNDGDEDGDAALSRGILVVMVMETVMMHCVEEFW